MKNNKQSFSSNKIDLFDINVRVAIAFGLAVIALLLAFVVLAK